MSRPRRNFKPGHRYHVVQRGNKGQWVYPDEEDFQFALNLLFETAAKYSVIVHQVCLTPSQGQWVLAPRDAKGISSLMRDMQSLLSKHLNRKYKNRPWKLSAPLDQSDADGEKWWRGQPLPLKNGVNWNPRFFAAELSREEYAAAGEYLRQGPSRAKLHAERRSCEIRGANPYSRIEVTLGRLAPIPVPEMPAAPAKTARAGPTDADVFQALARASRSRRPLTKVLACIRAERAEIPIGNGKCRRAGMEALPTGPSASSSIRSGPPGQPESFQL